MMSVYFFLHSIVMFFGSLGSHLSLEGISLFGETERVTVSTQQELQIEMPEQFKALPYDDGAWQVAQAKCSNMFIDLHSKDVDTPQPAEMDKTIDQRVGRTLERYQVRNAELQGQEEISVHDIPLEKYHYTGQKAGKDFEIDAVAVKAPQKVLVVTYFYHAGDADAKEDVKDSIESMKYVNKG
ncbi:hypothetical protein SAMN04487861_11173 [Selenomonas ruminantium]|uniref:DUF1795 domain-containing protein n=1 Tax=Selenomonas ruminantium TaxID=971 RepID=A0A1I3ES30_SELRU|nr:hypothetical protein [Selenomonas ruminantium]SFI01784.1 hypothetical protein SAMN04487861_11173 [Selenomonas ruminantium]